MLSSRLWNDVKIPQERDFGLDYRIEAISYGSLRGSEFYAQVKGFAEIESKETVRIRIATSTARYWSNKILPILIVAIDCKNCKGYFKWFKKFFELPIDQETISISIPISNELNDMRLQRSLEPYYQEFLETFSASKKNKFYKKLFGSSVLMLHMLLQTHNNLLFLQSESPEARRKYLTHYFTCLSGFIHDMQLYKLDVDLSHNPIDRSLANMLSHVVEMHSGMYSESIMEGSKAMFLVNEEAIYESLPNVSSIFSDIDLLFHKRLLK